MLSLYRFSWRSGSKITREPCLKFVEEADPPLHNLLSVLSGVMSANDFADLDRTMTKEKFLKINNPYDESIGFLHYLILTNDIESTKQLLDLHPYLWPSALVWGFRVRHTSALQLAKLKMPNYGGIDIKVLIF